MIEEKLDQSESSQEVEEKEDDYYIIVVRDSSVLLEDIKVLEEAFENGWILNTQVRSNPVKLENCAVYHFISTEAIPEHEKTPGAFDDVESLRSVPNDEVDALLKEGYVIHTIYAKNTILIKRRNPSDTVSATFGQGRIDIDKRYLPKEEKDEPEQKTDKQIYRRRKKDGEE